MHLDNGRIKYLGGNINKGIENYYSRFEGGELKIIENGLRLIQFKAGNESAKWFKIKKGYKKIVHTYLKDLYLSFEIDTNKPISNIGIVIRFFDRSLISVATCQNRIEYKRDLINMLIPKVQFGAGSYDMDIYFIEYDHFNNESILAHYKNFAALLIEESIIANHSAFQLDSEIFY
jgi:hypothetical protein